MKTIFRYTNTGLLLALVLAVGAVVGFAQDPCEDAAGQTALSDKFRADYAKKDLKGAVEVGKQYLEKYGACNAEGSPTKEFNDYLKSALPKLEEAERKRAEAELEKQLVTRFNAGLNSKNWDEVYASGKEILAKFPDKFRDVELALGSIGYDESYKNNFKYNEDTLKYAKMAIADLESGKTFSTSYGVPKDFVYKTKENALGWMNLTIGYILQSAQKNMKDAQPYLFKATQVNSETNKNPVPYELIGKYYFEELDKLTTEIKALADSQKPDDTEEVAKQKVDQIKAKVALSNGLAERAMDAFSRAYTLGQAPAYKALMKKNVESAYKLRFAKTEGVDAWIASTMSKPFPSPMTPVTPISDPEPAATSTTTKPSQASVEKPAAPVETKAVAPVTKTKAGAGAKSQTGKRSVNRRKG